MKKSLFLLGFVAISAQANLPNSFTQVLQSFSQENNLTYISESPNKGSYITYKFSNNPSCKDESCSDLRVYYSVDPNCIPETVSLFGELPVSIPNAKALFISPSLSDNSSQAHDFMRVQVNHGCYELSMGQQGSDFKKLVDLANRLAVAK